MEDLDIWTAAISSVGGLISGAIAGLAAPWTKWSIEKRRSDRQHKRALINSWREGLSITGHSLRDAMNSSWYETLRPYLDPEVKKALESPRRAIVPPDNNRRFKDLFTDEIDRIEREWKLRP